jgi:hypothetical protein
MKMLRTMMIAVAAMSLSACQGLGAMMSGGAPPAPLAATQIDDNAVNFALESFDASLYLVDAAIDTGRIKAGSTQAKSLAGLIRKVMRFLGAADAAQRAGQSASYADAFRNARAALTEFRAAIGQDTTAAMLVEPGGPASFRLLVRQANPRSVSAQVNRADIARRLDAGAKRKG